MNFHIFGKKITLYQIILHFIVIVLTFEVIILIGEIRTLRKGSDDYKKQVLKKGDTVQVVDIVSLDGTQRKFPDTKRKLISILILFHTKCPFCKDNIQKWNHLNERFKYDSIDIVAVSIHKKESTLEYVHQNGLKVSSFVPLDSAFLKVFKPFAVPQTIIISKDFRIIQNHLGVLSEIFADSLSAILNNKHHLTLN